VDKAPSSPPSFTRSLLAGLAAGAVAAVLASLLSLPLRSPDDVFFNTAAVTVAALVAGIAGSVFYWAVRSRTRSLRPFAVGIAATFVLLGVAVLAVEAAPKAPLDGVAGFVLPLGAVVLVAIGLVTPVFARPIWRAEWLGPTGAGVALVLGVALADRGDAESGALALPDLPPPSSPAAMAPARAQPATTAATDAAAPTPAAAPAAASTAAGAQNDGLLRPRDVSGAAFVIDSAESAATYTVREKLAALPLPNNAVGRTNTISGTIHLDGRPSTVKVDLRTLRSDQPMRDNFIRTRGGLPSDRYPFAEFTVAGLADLPAEYRPGDTVGRTVTGMMTIREVTRPLTFNVQARLQDNVLYILGATDFTWADFQIPPPTIAGIVQVEDTVHLEVLLVARREGA
jgi:polyisoprenoid-binding protein YceI